MSETPCQGSQLPPRDALECSDERDGEPPMLGGRRSAPFEPFLVAGRATPTERWDFDHFEAGRTNAVVLNIARTITSSEDRGAAYSPLLLVGAEALGKSHLLRAIAHATERRCLYVHATDLHTEIECAAQHGGQAELRAWLRSAAVLLIDDIHWCEHSQSLQQELLALLEYRSSGQWTTVLTSRRRPEDLRLQCQDVLSRLAGGIQVELHPVGPEARRQALQRFLHELNGSLPDDVSSHLAEAAPVNLRQMFAAACHLVAIGESDLPLSVDVARAVAPLSEDLRPTSRPPNDDEPLPGEAADRFKQMLQGADSEEEQGLALQIAVGERLRQLKKDGADQGAADLLEHVLVLLREGRIAEALTELEL